MIKHYENTTQQRYSNNSSNMLISNYFYKLLMFNTWPLGERETCLFNKKLRAFVSQTNVAMPKEHVMFTDSCTHLLLDIMIPK